MASERLPGSPLVGSRTDSVGLLCENSVDSRAAYTTRASYRAGRPTAAGAGVDSQNACHLPAGGPGVMLRVSCRVICILSQTRVISAAAASVVPSECSACQCAGRPARTASRHEAAAEVGGALAPKLVDELLLSELPLSELICSNQVVRERFRLATYAYSSLSIYSRRPGMFRRGSVKSQRRDRLWR
jgi:hypothetical protein